MLLRITVTHLLTWIIYITLKIFDSDTLVKGSSIIICFRRTNEAMKGILLK